MKKYYKQKSDISSKLHMIYISSNNVRHPFPKTFTTLHQTTLHSTSLHLSTLSSSLLNFTQLHFTTISFGLTPFKFPTAPFHHTSLHFTSLHCTFRRFSPHFYSFHFTPFVMAFLTLFLKLLDLQGRVPKLRASHGSYLFITRDHYFSLYSLKQ